MRLREALNNKKFDVRLQDKLIAEGKLSKEDVASHLDKLPDDQKNLQTIQDKKSASRPADMGGDDSMSH